MSRALVGTCIARRIAPLLQPLQDGTSRTPVASVAVSVPGRPALADGTHEALACRLRASALDPFGIRTSHFRMRQLSKKSHHER
jgi:hypothetical protein